MSTPFYLALNRAYHAQKNALRRQMGEVGLSPGQPKILHHLMGNNECMQKDLAAACDIEPATVSRILANMEAKGLVERTQRPDNRRAALIAITPAGRAAHARWEEVCRQVEKQELAGFTPEELQAPEAGMQQH